MRKVKLMEFSLLLLVKIHLDLAEEVEFFSGLIEAWEFCLGFSEFMRMVDAAMGSIERRKLQV